MPRPPLPPFTAETAAQKARLAEDAWNTRDPARVALGYTVDSIWRNRVPSDALAILLVSLTVMPLQIVFFAQHLAVDQPRGRHESDQADPIREYQKLASQDHHKRDIDRIAAEGKNAVHDELVGMVGVDADPEALPEGNQAP